MASEPTGCTCCSPERQETVQEYTRRKLLAEKPAVPYLTLFPALRDAAAACGYALAIHGSLTRDFDLIAVPWTEEATDAATLVEAVRAAGDLFMRPNEVGTPKPHGRLAFTLLPGGTMWVDLSVMPRRLRGAAAPQTPTAGTGEEARRDET